MPVRTKNRLTIVASSAAAMLVAAASASVCAQTANPQSADSQAAQPDQPPELRSTEPLGLEAATSPEAPPQTQPDNANPIAAAPPQYGLPAPISDTTDFLNYGKPKPKKPKLYQLPKLKKPGLVPLPPLTAYKTAPDTQQRGSNPPLADPANPDPTVAVVPILPRPKPPKPDLTPFAPLGIDVGSLRLYPFVEGDTGYDSNPNSLSTDVVGSPYVYTGTGLRAESQWSQHSLTADLRGGYYDYFRVPDANRPSAAGTVTGRIDVTRQTQINLVSTFDVETQQPGSPLFAIPNSVFITNRPLIVALGQSVGVTQQFNRLSISLIGAFSRYMFGNATQSDGTELLLALDSYNDYGVTARATYEVIPSLIPFIEVTGDERRYDNYLDVYGFARNSNGIAGKLGTTLEFSRLVTGQIAVGYADRVYVDPRLPNLNAPTIDAKLIYAATPLTTFTLDAATYLSETSFAYASGAVSRSVSLGVAHALRRDLTLSAIATYQYTIYDGQPVTEQLYSGMLKADYSLSRSVAITGSFTHERFQSTAPGEDYTANVFLVGLRLQD